jgi:hypothetical protein
MGWYKVFSYLSAVLYWFPLSRYTRTDIMMVFFFRLTIAFPVSIFRFAIESIVALLQHHITIFLCTVLEFKIRCPTRSSGSAFEHTFGRPRLRFLASCPDGY